MTRTFVVLRVLSLIAVSLAPPSYGRAMSTYYTAQGCSGCHGSSTVTCNGCHHHGPVNLRAVPNKTAFAPGETISVTLSGGSQSGWFRAAILDASNAVLAVKKGTPATGAFAPSGGATYPVTLTVAAPAAAGTYTWKGAWYGNGFDSGGIGGSGYIPDPTNGNHGYQPVSFTFTVGAPTCTAFTYSTWGACQTNGTQTRTVLTSSPSGCTGGTPVTTQSCTYSAPACTYTYSSWSACSTSGTQTRTVISSSPTGCTGTPVLSQSCTPSGATTDGPALYTQYCAGCHGALASSSKAGATATQIQTAIKNVGSMSSLSFLTAAQVQAIADALATPAPPPPTNGACGSCHAIPPTTGKHTLHFGSEGIGCATCHGSGYDGTRLTVNTNFHQDGKLQLTRKLRWDNATNSCSPNCHGTRTWTSGGGGGDGGGDGGGRKDDDIVIVDDAPTELTAGGCSSGGSATLFALAALAVSAILRRRRAHRQA